MQVAADGEALGLGVMPSQWTCRHGMRARLQANIPHMLRCTLEDLEEGLLAGMRASC